MKRALAIVCMLAAPAIAEPDKRASDPEKHPVSGVVEHARVELVPPGRPFKQLVVENPLGDVRIEGYDGRGLMIETQKHAPDADTLDRLRVSLIPNPDGTVRIATTADGSPEMQRVARSQVRIDLIIHAPRDMRVEAMVSAGKLAVVNMDAGGELDTSSGTIDVRNVSGGVLTHSVSGATSLAQVFGSVDAQTMSSNVDLDTISGDRLVASATKGRIAGRRVRSRDIELTTTDGKIMLEAEAALSGHLVVSSLYGDVEVKLHRHGAVIVRARGSRVDLGTQTPAPTNGWVQDTFGQVDGRMRPALVELRSRWGAVQLTVVQ
ncbi:MAG: hypothetical protein JWO36_6318 [Myxococcales bacterium]|nr:hypothetical protein [Myxococcales bacterium]